MAYTKQTWVNNETLVDEDRMNHIENGIYQNAEDISEINQSLTDFSIDLGRYSTLDDDNIGQAVMDFNAKLADGQFGAGYANLQGTIIIIFGARYNESRGRYIAQASTTNSIYTIRMTDTASCIVCSIQISSSTSVG